MNTATKTQPKTEKNQPKKIIVAINEVVAEALKLKVPDFKDAQVVTSYRNINNVVQGAEVLGTQMDVSIARSCLVFHQCVLIEKRETVDAICQMNKPELLLASMWNPQTMTVQKQSYTSWVIEAAKAPAEDLKFDK